MLVREASPERRRRVLIMAVALLLVVGGGVITSLAHAADETPRLVEIARGLAFVFLALVVGLRATTGFTLLKRDPAMNDELTRANRASAARAGFWAMMIGAVAALVASMYTTLTLAEAAPLLLVVGAAGAAVRFVILEARGE